MRKTIALVAATFLTGHALADEPAKGKQAYRTETVKRGPLASTVHAEGTLQPEEVIDVGTMVTGRILKFGVDPDNPKKSIDFGTQVKEGTVLAQIDPALYDARADQAKTELDRAKAQLVLAEAKFKKAERDWQRAQALAKMKAIDSDALPDIQSAFEIAKAQVRSTRPTCWSPRPRKEKPGSITTRQRYGRRSRGSLSTGASISVRRCRGVSRWRACS